MKLMNYLIDCYWNVKNVIETRLDCDYCSFWGELNLGYYQLRDEYIMKQSNFDPYNLSGRDSYYTYKLQ